MVRPRKTQTPQTPGLEAGAAYGEVSDSLAAQDAIPLPQKGGITTPPQVNPPAFEGPMAQGNPLAAAMAYTPQVTPLTAQGQGPQGMMGPPMPTPQEDAAQMLRNWAEAVNEPALVDAAIQLSQ